MASDAVQYNVAITGVLPGNKAADAAEIVAPVLGLLPSDAIHLFNGIPHTVLQRADLSAAASFQAELKNMGIDASVEVFKERFGASVPDDTPVEVEEAVDELAAEADDEIAEEIVEEIAQDEFEDLTSDVDIEAAATTENEPANEAAKAVESSPQESLSDTESDLADAADDNVELVPSLLDDAERAAAQSEAENLIDAFENTEAPASRPEQAAPAKTAAKKAPPRKKAPPSDIDLDTLLEEEAAEKASTPAPAARTKTPAKPAAAAKKPASKRKVAAKSAPVTDIPAVPLAPVRNVSPGSNMLCFSCNSLQPRADICPACGAIQPHAAQPQEKKKPRLPPRLPQKSLVAAGAAAAVGAGIWVGVAFNTSIDTGFFALIIGCLVGAACGLLGGRGSKAGNASAGIALAGILIATLLLPRPPVEIPVAPPQPNAAEVWSEEQGPKWFDEAFSDAETFMTMDGSAESVRQFMVQHSYTLARKPEDVPQEDQQYFYDVDAPDLSWIVRNQPDYSTWRARMQGHLSGRQRVLLGVSTPLPGPTPPPISILQLIFMVSGLGAAFLLGFLGLKRDQDGDADQA
ncbi:MAG: hypothetical protein AAGI24_13500 [Pseudomonadota bacterium]